jgi:hypothetical protein
VKNGLPGKDELPAIFKLVLEDGFRLVPDTAVEPEKSLLLM